MAITGAVDDALHCIQESGAAQSCLLELLVLSWGIVGGQSAYSPECCEVYLLS